MYSQHEKNWPLIVRGGTVFVLLLWTALAYFGCPLQALAVFSFLVVLLWWWFEHDLWKLMPRWIVPDPDLNGRWEGIRISTADKKETRMVLEMRQTLTGIKCWAWTDKGHAYSYCANLISDKSGEFFELVIVYHSEGNADKSVAGDSHDGFFKLRYIEGEKELANKLHGKYANDRDNGQAKARVELNFISKELRGEF